MPNKDLSSHKYDLIVFDLDGTIIDTAPDLAKAVNYILGSEYNLSPLSLEQNRMFIGGGFRLLFKNALDYYQVNVENFESVIEKAYNYFDNINGEKAEVYLGIIKTFELLQLNKIKIGILTNKIERFSLPLLKKMQLTKYFDFIVSGDTYAIKKPDPQVLHQCCSLVNTTSDKTILIGDTKFDVQTAKAAGALSVCVDYGYSEIDPNDLDADLVIPSIYDFVKDIYKKN